MNVEEGLLWFDKSTIDLADKVVQAATRYEEKTGQAPDTCYLNDADADGETEKVNGVRLRTASNVLRHHLWLGVDDS